MSSASRLIDHQKRWTERCLDPEGQDIDSQRRVIGALYAGLGLPTPQLDVCSSPADAAAHIAKTGLDTEFWQRLVRLRINAAVEERREQAFTKLGIDRTNEIIEGPAEAVHETIDTRVLEPLGSAGGQELSRRLGRPGQGYSSTRSEAPSAKSAPGLHYGGVDSFWLAFFDYLHRVERFAPPEVLADAIHLSLHGGPWWPGRSRVLLQKRPVSLHLGVDGRLHSTAGAAATYQDGAALYFLSGIPVPPWVVETPERLSVAHIEREPNAEVQRVLIEQFGADRFVSESGARLLSSDAFGDLFVYDRTEGERVALVRVRNATPEPTGEFKEYFLRVPPWMQSPREAVAWTFSIDDPESYGPVQQT